MSRIGVSGSHVATIAAFNHSYADRGSSLPGQVHREKSSRQPSADDRDFSQRDLVLPRAEFGQTRVSRPSCRSGRPASIPGVRRVATPEVVNKYGTDFGLLRTSVRPFSLRELISFWTL